MKAVRPEASDGNNDKETVQGHEPRFRALFELSPDGIIILDLKGRILNVNKSFLNLSGYEREDFVGKHFSRIPSRLPMDLENYKSFFNAVLHRDLTDLEFNWRHKSGTIMRGLARIKVMRERTEAPFVMAVIRDIGPRREKSAGMFVQRNFYETILEKLNEGIWVSNWKDEIVFANPAMERISGLPREEILGKNVLHDFPRETIENFSNYYNRVRRDLQPTEYETGVVTPTGKSAIQSGWIFPITSEGKFDGIICSVLDVTDHKEAEEFIQNALTMKDLLMRESNHRLKNNLAIISSLISLKSRTLDESVDLSDLQHQINAIRTVHDRLAHSDDISRIDFGPYLDDLLGQLFSPLSPPVTVRHTVKNLSLSPTTAIPLGLIINELATNAIKYGFSSEGPHSFAVNLKEEEGRLVFTISNTGPPFPEDVSIDTPNSLGLQLISVLVRQLNGELHLQRSPQPVFTLSIPEEKPPEEKPPEDGGEKKDN